MLTLEFARRQRRWSQHQLSALTHIPQHFISLVECGRGIPTAAQLERLARALDVPAETLLQPALLQTPHREVMA